MGQRTGLIALDGFGYVACGEASDIRGRDIVLLVGLAPYLPWPENTTKEGFEGVELCDNSPEWLISMPLSLSPAPSLGKSEYEYDPKEFATLWSGM